jgi:hypothetical protein
LRLIAAHDPPTFAGWTLQSPVSPSQDAAPQSDDAQALTPTIWHPRLASEAQKPARHPFPHMLLVGIADHDVRLFVTSQRWHQLAGRPGRTAPFA